VRHLTLGRGPYWILVAVLVVLKVGVVVGIDAAPQAYPVLRHVDTAIIAVLAIVVAGRFADIGWPRWLGIVFVLLIAVLLSIALFLLSPRIPVATSSPLDVVPDLAWISTVLFVILLIVAGVKRGRSGGGDGSSEKDAGGDGRQEPTFP
jgi:hypothetical protein